MSNEYPKRYDNEQVKNYVKSVNWSKRLDKEIPFLAKLFTDHNYKDICDFGCGPGMHATRLAKMGSFNVTGLDIDEHMISYASQTSKDQKLDNLSFFQGNFLDHPEQFKQFRNRFDAMYTLENIDNRSWLTIGPNNHKRISKSIHGIKSILKLFKLFRLI